MLIVKGLKDMTDKERYIKTGALVQKYQECQNELKAWKEKAREISRVFHKVSHELDLAPVRATEGRLPDTSQVATDVDIGEARAVLQGIYNLVKRMNKIEVELKELGIRL